MMERAGDDFGGIQALPEDGGTHLVSQSNLDALESGITSALDRVQVLLDAEAYAETLPIIGSQLHSNANVQATVQTITKLRDTIVNAIDQVSNLSGLASMTAAQVQSQLQNQLNAALTSLSNMGLGFVGAATVTVASNGDIGISFDTGRTSTATFHAGDLGMSGLGLQMSGDASAALSYNFDFKVGLDGSGFYLDTGASNLSLGAKVSLNNLTAETDLGFLHFQASNITDSDPAAGADTLNLNLVTEWAQSGLIRNFTSDILNVRASGDVDLDVHLAADMGNAALPSIGADLHVDWGFNQNLLNGSGANSWNAATVTFDNVHYDFGSFVEHYVTPILEQLDPILGPINDALKVLHTDISGLLLPEWAEMLDLVEPEKNEVTVLDFLQLASNVGNLGIDFGPLAQIIDLVDTIVDTVEFFRGRDFDDAGYNVGSYQTQLQQIQGAVDTLSHLDINTGTFTSVAANIDTFLAGLGGLDGFGDSHSGETHEGESGASIIGSLIDNPLLNFSLVENPLSVIRLLLGQDVDLFKLDMPAVNIGIGMDGNGNVTAPITAASLPIWPLPLVTGNLNVAFQAVIDLAFGYDSTGLREYAQGGFNDPLAIIHGFYLDDQRSGGTDLPEIVLRAAVEIALDANLAVVSIGGAGNVTGEVKLDFADSLFGADGRLYVNEITGDLLTNPFQIFDVEGRISAGLRFYVNSVLGNLVNWNSPRQTLVDFSFVQGAEDSGPPPGLGDWFGDTGALWVNVGNRAGERDIADHSDTGEFVEISAAPGGKVVVSGFGTAQVFGADGAVTSIQIDANAGNDDIRIANSVQIAARITGGAGVDSLTGGGAADQIYGGTQDDWLQGQGGADLLEGEDGNDYLEGGAGGDQLHGGNGLDTATYVGADTGIVLNFTTGVHENDAAGDSFASIEIYEGSHHDDTMIGGSGADIFTGIEGDDQLRGMGGDDILAGGAGANNLDGGAGYDIANYFNATSGVTVAMTDLAGTVVAGPVGSRTVNDVLAGIEQVDGSRFGDSMTGGAGRQVFVGAEGNDTLNGGLGDDVLVGSEGGDSLIGGDGIDTASYINALDGVTMNLATGGTGGEALGDSYATIENVRGSEYDDRLTGDGDANFIYAGLGDDRLFGGGGDDVLEGAEGSDSLDGGDGYDIASYLNAGGAIGIDLVNGTRSGVAIGDSYTEIEVYQGSQGFGDTIRGSNSAEEIRGEGGDDTLYGADGGDTLLGGAGIDTIHGDDGVDLVRGGDGNDVLYGDAANDTLYGGLNNDTLDGGAADDVLDGEQGTDTLKGGAGADLLRGGQGNDSFDGGSERDRVTYADSTAGIFLNLGTTSRTLGSTVVAGLRGLDGFGGTDSFVAAGGVSTVEDATGSNFADQIVGSEGGSRLYGLGGNDVIVGLQGADLIEGGAGADSIDGGGGTQDMASWENDVAGVTASLLTATGTATDGWGATDTLLRIEWLRGSGYGDSLTGGTGANRLEGLAGNDVLDGSTGGDTLIGGVGDDIYYVDSVASATPADNDIVIEASGQGSDLIRSSVNYTVTLADNVEDLQLLGSVAIGTGNGLANRLIGNNSANIFDGLSGADTYWGYGGDDTYVFDEWGDTIGLGSAPRSSIAGDGEVAGGGNDTIRLATANIHGTNGSVSTYTLDTAWSQQVENLELTDDVRRVNLTGNALGNRLVGNAWYQEIHGGEGNDWIDPGDGGDYVLGEGGDDTLALTWGDKTSGVSTYYNPGGDTTAGYGGSYRIADYGWYVDYSSIRNFHITTGSASDSIRTADGDDIVKLGAGDDFVTIGAGTDQGDGEAGTDGISADLSAESGDIVWNLQTNVFSGSADSFTNFEYFGTLYTGSGNDTVVTGKAGAHETVYTGAGNDSVTFFDNGEHYYAGTGLDTMVIDWSGYTSGASNYYNPGAAGEGGWAGSFRIGDYGWYIDYDSVERFVISTGSGSDNLLTADGDDVIKLGAGDDFVNVVTGTDSADGQGGTDGVSADLRAETGNIVWNLQTNSFSGSADSFTNFEYFGTVYTGSGNDTVVTGKAGAYETVYTGAGNDSVTFFDNGERYYGGTGLDTMVIDWSGYTSGASNYYNPGAAGDGGWAGSFRIGDYGWYIDYDSVERFVISTGSGNDNLLTADGNDVIKLGAGDDFVNVVTGTDSADGEGGTDGVSADLSAETGNIVWNLQTNVFSGSADSFTNFEYFGTIATGSGNDTIVSGKADRYETIYTGAGNDSITVFDSGDHVVGGIGTDTLVIDWSAKNFGVTNYYNPGAAGDGGWAGSYRIGDLGWYLDYDSIENFRITTGNANDSFVTADGNDVIVLNGGDDFVNVAAGTDRADGGSGTDGVSANLAAETGNIVWNLQTNVFSGSADSFTNFEYFGTVSTGSGNDTIVTGKAGAYETIYAGAGNDSITVFDNGDHVVGGTGTDTLIIDWSAKDLGVTNYYSPFAAGDGGWAGSYRLADLGWYLDYDSIENFRITTGNANDNFVTANGNDVIALNGGDDFVNVASGTDKADGGSGTDGISADLGAETGNIVWNLQANSFSGSADSFTNFEYFGTVTTGSGNDVVTTTGVDASETISTGAGNDTVTVRAGSDTVYAGTGKDTLVLDWSGRTGPISNYGGIWADPDGGWVGTFNASWNGWYFNYYSVEVFVIRGGDAGDSIVTQNGADTLEGNGGNDYLDGGAGADKMRGGAGDDRFIVDNVGDTVAEADGEGTDTVESSVSFSLAGQYAEILRLTGTAAINATGNGLANLLTGNSAANVLNGGGGADQMEGGMGNDRYIVDNLGDVVIEAGGAGTDRVDSSVSFTLSANVESLVLTGTAAIDGTGNALDNAITGNSGANVLDGGAGADTMAGGNGNDIFYVDNIGDKAIEQTGQGKDTVYSSVTFSLGGQYTEILVLTGAAAINGTGNSQNNTITGNSGANVLVGGAGDDRLDGGAGADTLRGGLGADTFVIDQAGDIAQENANEGTDTVEAWISYSLAGQNIEYLTLMGTANLNGTGNGLANKLIGNSGSNILNGGAGADEMYGGAGDDRFVVDNAGDKVFELNGEGTDTVESSVTFSLAGQFLENLTLTGAGAINGTGNSFANIITGNSAINTLNGGTGDDQLHGGLGSDTLTGGAGLDSFWFETALGATNVDSITDFKAADDTIYLDRTIFAGIAANGALAAGAFYQGSAAHDADDRIVYNKTTGDIWYDADGVGGAAAVVFAHVAANTAMTAADFFAVP